MSYAVPENIHHELLNWARFQWSGPWPHPIPSEKCGSAEREFHAEWHQEWEPELVTVIRPNRARAEAVHAVWKDLWDAPRLVLKAEYIEHHKDRQRAARKLAIPVHVYESHLAYAVRKVGEAL